MKYKVTRIFCMPLVLTFFLFLSACAPGLGKSLSVSRVPEPSPEEKVLPLMTRGEAPLLVSIEGVRDARTSQAVGVIGGRSLAAKENPEQALRELIEYEFVRFGAKMQANDGVSVLADIEEWAVEVEPGFPSSSADALAVLHLGVTTHDGQKIYSGKYEGSAVTEHPWLSEKKIEETLGYAMQQAVRAAIRDEAFRLALMNASLP